MAATREEVYERVKDVLVEQLGVDENEINEEASFQEDLDADSLDLVELIMELEDQFGIKISDEDALPHRVQGELRCRRQGDGPGRLAARDRRKGRRPGRPRAARHESERPRGAARGRARSAVPRARVRADRAGGRRRVRAADRLR